MKTTFKENYFGYVSNNSRKLEDFGAPAHLITSGNGSDLEHDKITTVLQDASFADTDIMIFDTNEAVTFAELRKICDIKQTYKPGIIARRF